MPLEAHLPVVGCRGGDELARELFEPLGYEVATATIPLDTTIPDWGDSRYLDITIRGRVLLRDLLRHLYVLLPVMDDDKHYWVERSEIDKLLAKGGDWLGDHPHRELITRRYLRYRGSLMREALARLTEDDEAVPDESGASRGRPRAAGEPGATSASARCCRCSGRRALGPFWISAAAAGSSSGR